MARHEYTPLPDADNRGEEIELHGVDSDDEGEDVLIMNTAGPTALSPMGAQAATTESGTTHQTAIGTTSDRHVATNGVGSANSNSNTPAIDTTITSQAPLGYDYPPPGSPPASASRPTHSSSLSISTPRILSAFAIPNSFGNTNGIIPTRADIVRELRAPLRGQTFIRRAVGRFWPKYYRRVPQNEDEANAAENGVAGPSRQDNGAGPSGSSAGGPRRLVGGGLENDGVFANVMAKPTVRTVTDEDGNVHVMPEEAQKDVPPSYATAQADAVPPYWETAINSSSSGPLSTEDGLILEGIPTGTLFSFAWNFLISISFQFVGFMLTYLLHTTHAAKFGSRAGLGVTLIQYGLYSRGQDTDGTSDDIWGESGDVSTLIGGNVDTPTQVGRLVKRGLVLAVRSFIPMGSTSPADNSTMSGDAPPPGMMTGSVYGSSLKDWLSFFLMTIGWFLLLSSVLGFFRVKRWEREVLTTGSGSDPVSPEAIARDQQIRHNLHQVFGIGAADEEEEELVIRDMGLEEGRDDGEHDEDVEDAELTEQEAGLRRNLRLAGLI